MNKSMTTGSFIPDFCLEYGNYLFRIRGLSASQDNRGPLRLLASGMGEVSVAA